MQLTSQIECYCQLSPGGRLMTGFISFLVTLNTHRPFSQVLLLRGILLKIFRTTVSSLRYWDPLIPVPLFSHGSLNPHCKISFSQSKRYILIRGKKCHIQHSKSLLSFGVWCYRRAFWRLYTFLCLDITSLLFRYAQNDFQATNICIIVLDLFLHYFFHSYCWISSVCIFRPFNFFFLFSQ